MNMDRLQSSVSAISAVHPASAIVRGVSMGDGRRSLGKPRSEAASAHDSALDATESPSALATPYALSPADLMASGGLSVHEHGFQAGYQEGLRLGREAGEAAGHQAGFEQGLTEGRQEAERVAQELALRERERATLVQEERLNGQHQRLERWLDQLAEQQASLLDKHTDDLLALCFDAVSRVVGQLMQEPEQVLELVRSVLQHATSFTNLCVRLHPDDLGLVQDVVAQCPDRLRADLVLKADPQVTLGGVLLHSDQGALDARLEVQMARFARFLIDQRERRLAAGGDS